MNLPHLSDNESASESGPDAAGAASEAVKPHCGTAVDAARPGPCCIIVG